MVAAGGAGGVVHVKNVIVTTDSLLLGGKGGKGGRAGLSQRLDWILK